MIERAISGSLTVLERVLLLAEPTPKKESSFVWVLIVICGFISVGAFLALWFLTKKSEREVKDDVRERLENLYTVVRQSRDRFAKLDAMVIDRMRTLSQKGSQSYSVAKAIVSTMEQRIEKVEKLLVSKTTDDLLRAQKLLHTPIENTGDSMSTVIFGDTILNLQPEQVELAIDMVLNAVEKDITRPPGSASSSTHAAVEPSRRRRFTIRGFLKSLAE